MDLVRLIVDLDQSPHLHAARLLILLDVFANSNGDGAVDGLTKLAKLDFLLRYPVMLERALAAKGRRARDLHLQDHERLSVESEMVRYRFGPWDHRYREILNTLVGKGLATVAVTGRTVTIAATARGREVARMIVDEEQFSVYADRSRILKRHFDISGTNLMRFIYATFPEVVSLRSNARIRT